MSYLKPVLLLFLISCFISNEKGQDSHFNIRMYIGGSGKGLTYVINSDSIFVYEIDYFEVNDTLLVYQNTINDITNNPLMDSIYKCSNGNDCIYLDGFDYSFYKLDFFMGDSLMRKIVINDFACDCGDEIDSLFRLINYAITDSNYTLQPWYYYDDKYYKDPDILDDDFDDLKIED